MVNAEKLVITLTGGAPWGFRLSGGGGLPLIINKIRKKSPAHKQGLQEGDAVISINGKHVHDKSQDQALELVEMAGESLALEIYRGDIDEISQTKERKPIPIPQGVIVAAQPEDDNASFEATSQGFTLTASVDEVTSDTFHTPPDTALVSDGGFQLTATVDDVSGSTYSTGDNDVSGGSGFTLTSTVDEMTSSATGGLESSPVFLVADADMSTSMHSAEVEAISASAGSPVLLATPYVDSTVVVEQDPTRLSPNPPRSRSRSAKKNSSSPQGPSKQTMSPASPSNGPKVQQPYSPQPQVLSPQPQAYSPKPQMFSPPPVTSRSPLQAWSPNQSKPQAPPTSPKPVKVSAPVPKKSIAVGGGFSTSVSTSTFDDGNTRREVTHQVQRSDDGRSTATLHREKTTTTTTSSTSAPSNFNKKASAFNVVQPATNGHEPQKKISSSTTTTSTSSTLKTTTNQRPQKPQQHQQHVNVISTSRSAGELSMPMFKPSKFVPGQGKKEIPGLFAPGSPWMDAEGNLVMGKENVAPHFEVKNIVSDHAKSRGRDKWRPNMWLPDQAPAVTTKRPDLDTPTSKDDFSPYLTFPLPKVRQGYSLVQEQKKRLETPSARTDFDFDYYDGNDRDEHHHHHRPGKLHVFAPPVEIHADGVYDSPTSPYITFNAAGEPVYMYEYEDELLSPDSTLRKRNLYSDSAFYDTPGKSYPTIREQMQLCKKIAQSLTSAANRRARGAKMFMRRKRKSGKWVHEGHHSEWSSSAGDVANIRDLESELSPDEGGSKPLLYFKIPNLKNRVGTKAKQTKMALTQEQFERLRLEAKKCDHNNVPPDTCFGIVADLKAHKGKGGRMFERRRERSDRYVIDEKNARPTGQHGRLEHGLSQPMKQDKTPWEAAMEHGGNVDAAFSHLSEWERNQRMNTMYKASTLPTRKVTQVQTAPLPVVHTSLKGESAYLLRGKDFNRVARGWRGGGEYPVAERLHHVSPTRQAGPSSPSTNYNNKIKAWQNPGESPYAPAPAATLPEPTRNDSWTIKRQDEPWQSSRVEFRPSSAPHNPNPIRPVSWQSESYHSGMLGEDDYTYAPVDYRYTPESYPTVAYMQPIIPGTDC